MESTTEISRYARNDNYSERLLRYISKTHPMRCRQVPLRSLIWEELDSSAE